MELPNTEAMSSEEKIWFARAIAGMIVADGRVDDSELEFLKEAISFHYSQVSCGVDGRRWENVRDRNYLLRLFGRSVGLHQQYPHEAMEDSTGNAGSNQAIGKNLCW